MTTPMSLNKTTANPPPFQYSLSTMLLLSVGTAVTVGALLWEGFFSLVGLSIILAFWAAGTMTALANRTMPPGDLGAKTTSAIAATIVATLQLAWVVEYGEVLRPSRGWGLGPFWRYLAIYGEGLQRKGWLFLSTALTFYVLGCIGTWQSWRRKMPYFWSTWLLLACVCLFLLLAFAFPGPIIEHASAPY